MPKNLKTLAFGDHYNHKIDSNILPDNIKTLYFGEHYNQIINVEILPSNLKYIKFNWLGWNSDKYINYFNMINNIPSYYNVVIFVRKDIFENNGIKWPIHVIRYKKKIWSSEKYKIIDKYTHPLYRDITVLINKETHEPYIRAKSALK